METYSLALLNSAQQWDDEAFLDLWGERANERGCVEALYRSPDWYGHLARVRPSQQLLLARLEDADGQVAGVAPIRVGRHTLKFDVAARSLLTHSFGTAFLLGSQPALPPEEASHDCLFETIWRQVPDCECIYMDSVPLDSFLWKYLHHRQGDDARALLYVPDGTRQHHVIDLPNSFDEYLTKFSSKTRNTLRRKEKQLARRGPLRLLRAESEDDVNTFLADAVRVSRNSWQHAVLGTRLRHDDSERERLRDLASHGLFRSYLLYCDGKPCAFILGYQYRGVFHYVEVGYDRRFGSGSQSPSIVLLYKVIQDLIEYRPAHCLNFGVGDAGYKKMFGNRSFHDASVLLLRRSFRNRLLRTGHFSFRSSVHGAKQVLSRFRRR